MRVLVCGSRAWRDRTLLFQTLDRLSSKAKVFEILTGGCPHGADRMAFEWAREKGKKITLYPADWDTHGKAAGPIRNSLMISTGPDLIVAFPTKGSRGTFDTVEKAERAGIEVLVVYP